MIHRIISPFHFSDADYYYRIAQGFLNGQGMNIPFPPPATAFFLIGAVTLVGENPYYLKLLYILLGTLSLLWVYLSLRMLYGVAVALLSLLLCSLSFSLTDITTALNTENIYLFTSSLSVYLFLLLYKMEGWGERFPFGVSLLFGFSVAMALLSRSEFALIASALLLFGIFRKGMGVKRKARIVFTSLCASLLLLSPWMVRNYYYMQWFNTAYPKAELPLFVPVALNGPFNFYEGHNPKANGTYAPEFVGKLEQGYKAWINPENEEHLRIVRDGYKMGWDYIRTHKERELSLLFVKLNVLLNGFSNGYGPDNFPAGLSGTVPSFADSFVPSGRGGLWLNLSLAFLGIFALMRRREWGGIRFLPLLTVGSVFVTGLLFYALSRMLYPLLPWAFALMALGMTEVWMLFRRWLNEQFGIKFSFSQKGTVAGSIAGVVLLFSFILYQGGEKRIFLEGVSGEYGSHSLTLWKRE